MKNAFNLISLSSILLVSCTQPSERSFTPAETFDPLAFQDVWMSQGYGQATEFYDGGLRNYSVTDKTCVAEPADELSGIHFANRIKRSDDGSTILLFNHTDPFEYEYRKLVDLSEVCPNFTKNTPLGNFDAFADYYDTHYAFFDLYGVNWPERSAKARAKISNQTGDAELFDIMTEAITPLADAHIGLDAVIKGEEMSYDANPGVTESALANYAAKNNISENRAVGQFRMAHWFDGVQTQILKDKGTITANDRIQYGMASDNVGYFAVVSMGGYIDGEVDSLLEEDKVTDRVLDEAITFFKTNDASAIILDLSLNSGGYDFIGLQIADRFATNGDMTAFTKKPGDLPGAKPFAYKIGGDPDKIRFDGKVYLMISDLTVSAGEMVPLSLRGLDHVTLVGQKSRGAFSTSLVKFLPNGWSMSLSNEIYQDRDGNVWEGKGIPPDIDIMVFDTEDPRQGHIQAVEKILKLAADQ